MIEVDPASGKILREVRFPDSTMMTSAAFGGPSLADLFVTSARIGDPAKLLPEAGSLFRVTGLGDDVKGMPAVEFSRASLDRLLSELK